MVCVDIIFMDMIMIVTNILMTVFWSWLGRGGAMIALMVLLAGSLAEVVEVKRVSEMEKKSQFWIDEGRAAVAGAELRSLSTEKTARNVVLFIGDGMGPATVTAARILANQRRMNDPGPDRPLAMETLSHAGLSMTYCLNDYVSDSAATATALLTGIKINAMVISLSPRILHNNCTDYDPNVDDLETIADKFHKEGRSVGIVTTTRVTHATPAAVYAHIPNRDWEASVPRRCSGVKDIASQLIDKAHQYKVVLGGGRSMFLPITKGGSRKDGRDLLQAWRKKLSSFKAEQIQTAAELRDLNTTQLDYIFGLFNRDHMSYVSEKSSEPSLAEMTTLAIKILQKNPLGFFLLVEGGRIDHAHHDSMAQKALLETLALDEAIQTARQLVDMNDTLMLVTADHSHVFTIGSYARRDEDILGQNMAWFGKEKDGYGHTTLLYSNGPGYQTPRANATGLGRPSVNHVYSSGVPLESETHGGEDVAVYAEGPWAHLVSGVHQQSYFAHLMMHAACLSPLPKPTPPHCNKRSPISGPLSGVAISIPTCDKLHFFLTALMAALHCF